MGAQFIIRLDDASEYMSYSKWEPFFSLFDKYQISPIIAVIPENKDPELIKNDPDSAFWEKVKIWESKNYVIALHGYNHLYSNNDGGILNINNYSEFAGISYGTQVQMIREGIKIFNSKGISTKIFVAPAHSFDQNTIKALNLLNIEIISDGFFINAVFRRGIKWIPQQLWSPKQKKKGIWTICIHPETANQLVIYNLNKFIEKNSKKFIHPYSIEYKENFTFNESILNLFISERIKLVKIKNLIYKKFNL